MALETWTYYALAVLVLTASPGPSSLLCLTRGVTQGFSRALLTALGSLTAITIILSLSFTGLGVVIASSEIVFTVIKWLGAGYLIYLGYCSLRSSQQDFDIITAQDESQLMPLWRSFFSGFIVGASNPKAILFFTALFPQFIEPSAPLLQQYSVFTATFVVMELTWLIFYAYLGVRSSRWLFQQGRAKLFNRLTGGVFISAGLFLSTTSRA